MTHSITCKINKDARQHPNPSGVTFFVSLGEKNYSHKLKKSVWTNYEAALFAKEKQIQYYTDVLKAGSIITVSGTGVIVEVDNTGKYEPQLSIQNAKLEFAMAMDVPMPPVVQQQMATQVGESFRDGIQAAALCKEKPATPAPDNFDDDIPF